ncbi:hypothetical protein [Vibrio alfacsensis]|uniref:hypothetical protein n=1 Tax=Vibrio alfacsensis TaxID=1074311 RepID=UPI0040682672
MENKNYSVDKACSDLGITAREFHFAKATLFTMTPYQTDELTSSQPTDWCLTNEAFFNYLQYKEFEHSLANSKKSNWFAILALLISIVSLGVTSFGIFV